MSQGLFRQQAIKHQSARLDGEVVIAQPVSSSLLTGALVLVVAALVVLCTEMIELLALNSF
jgi:membrane fusion protein